MPIHHLPNLLSSWSICLFALLMLSGTEADEDESPAATITGIDEPVVPKVELATLQTFHHYAHTLHELTERRRSTVHFENQQSILRGAQVGFVNVGDGNLTVARRDLVVVGILPIVIARIYDSSAQDSGDFGPGWRLSIAETITLQADGAASLLNESGSAMRFIEQDRQYVQETPHPTDILSLTRRNRHVFEMKLLSGIEKRYRLIDGVFRLSQIIDRNANAIRLHYEQGMLVRVEAMNGRFVMFDRAESGSVAEVTDDQNRSVAYRYDSQGQLVEVLDLGGNAWTYMYGLDGRLTAALDPLRYTDFSIQYDQQGRAAEVTDRGQTTNYEYAGNTSRVLDNRGRGSVFTQNDAGITVSVRSHVGVTTRVELDEMNRVSELHRNGITKAAFSYDEHGRLSSLRQLIEDGLQTITYRYDRASRLTSANDDTGRLRLIVRYDPNGNVRLVQRGDEKTIYRHARNGALQAFSRPDGKRYAFEADADGQITKVINQEDEVIDLRYLPAGKLEHIQFADGSTHTYGYEAVGLRASIQPSDAKLLRTYYSASGNLTLLEHISSSGAIQSDYYEYDATNRLNRIKFDRPAANGITESARELSYDKAGEVVNEQTPASELRFSYDNQDRLLGVANGQKTMIYSYAEDEPDIRLQLDHETRINLLPWSNSGNTIGAANEVIHNRTRLVPYQTIYLDENLDVFRLVSDLGIVLPHQAMEDSLARMRLLDLKESSFANKAHFSRPSNILFIPGEYRSINCYGGPYCWTNGIKDPPGAASIFHRTAADDADIEACEDDDAGGGGWLPAGAAAAYAFHTNNFTTGRSDSSITVSGNTITANTKIFTLLSDEFTDLKAGSKMRGKQLKCTRPPAIQFE